LDGNIGRKNTGRKPNETAKVQQLWIKHKALNQSRCIYNLSATADKIVKEAPDSVQAIQTELMMAKVAYDKADYAAAKSIEES
jgi:predicted negative regulator of RcsB-dependent stress response